MEWQDWAGQLTDLLGLKRLPVGVTYVDTPPEGAETPKCRVCSALLSASQGEVVDLSAANSTCPGGSQYLGLAPQPPGRGQILRNFLISGEKLFSCPSSIYRSGFLAKVQPPFGLADHVIFSPLKSAVLKPDVAVFVGNAQQAARLITLANFEDGLPMECDPTGAECRSVVTYPLVTNKINVSFGDITARRMEKYADDELFVSLPYASLRSAITSIDHCSAGRAKPVLPPAMRQVMEEAGGEPIEL